MMLLTAAVLVGAVLVASSVGRTPSVTVNDRRTVVVNLQVTRISQVVNVLAVEARPAFPAPARLVRQAYLPPAPPRPPLLTA